MSVHSPRASTASAGGGDVSEQIAAANGRIDALLDELRARTDAVIDEQADRIERWQEQQEARFDRALREQRVWLEQRLAELDAATRGAGGSVQSAAAHAVRSAAESIERSTDDARSRVEVASAQARRAAEEAIRAVADARATLEAAAADAVGAADRSARDIRAALDAATSRAAQDLATLREGLGHQAANLHAHAHHAPTPPGTAAAENWASVLRELTERAERIVGMPGLESAMPAHEAPAPWPPAPLPGSLADLVGRSQAVLTRARLLVNDLSRQIHAGEAARDALEGTVQDVVSTVRGQRDQLEQVRSLVNSGFEAGFELETVLGDSIVEARTAAERLENVREVGSSLRATLTEARRVTVAIDERLGMLRQQGQQLTGVVASLRSVVDEGGARAA